MSTTITGKLNKAANEFQAGDSIGFGIRLGVKYYDRETSQNEWTNYECVVFAKAQGQVDFYRQALVEGSVIEVSGKELKIKKFQGNQGDVLSIEILGASLGYVSTGSQPARQSAPQPNGIIPPKPEQAPRGFPSQQPAGNNTGFSNPPPPAGPDQFDSFEGDIPF